MTEPRKTCHDCGQKKPVSEFNKAPRKLHNVQPYCRECQKLRSKKRRDHVRTHHIPSEKFSAGRPEFKAPISLPILPCLARIDALLERR